MKIQISIIACLIITATACSTLKKTNTNFVDSKINNIAWAITSFRGKALQGSDFPNGMPTIIFNMQEGKINGNDGCNNFVGLSGYTNGSIKPGAIASTKMACANASFTNDLYEVLASAKITYRLDNGILRLYVNDAEVMALREKQ